MKDKSNVLKLFFAQNDKMPRHFTSSRFFCLSTIGMGLTRPLFGSNYLPKGRFVVQKRQV
jgi:hypothetical protein